MTTKIMAMVDALGNLVDFTLLKLRSPKQSQLIESRF